ncbi:TIGR04283 family arsenosugar biosynthesis glycosyltransferase [Gilvibacter sp.]|uniref:TIGR04283 family arsenosugar biosynthesis glycosyltransferase n=1 Tax=Gilvibacter sp. TaxID=2729997 RepID=UPI003F4A26C4
MNNKSPKLSIIVPVLNEADQLYTLLQHLYQQMSFPEQVEVLIIDGGSTDESAKEFERYHNQHTEFNLKWISSSEKGRAVQMNLGAQNAIGAIFYFLHADSLPPVGFDALIYREVERDNQAGCFRMRFDSSHWWLRLAGWLTRLNWKICRGGDQSQFITRELFENIGGFDESYRIFEDNMLIEALYKRGQFTVIPKTLVTSCRRYEKTGIWKLQYHFWMIQLKHRRGAGPEHLYAYYQKHLAK